MGQIKTRLSSVMNDPEKLREELNSIREEAKRNQELKKLLKIAVLKDKENKRKERKEKEMNVGKGLRAMKKALMAPSKVEIIRP